MADRARTIIDRVRASHRAFEAARLNVQAELKLLADMGGNGATNAYMDVNGKGGSGPNAGIVDMSTAEWQSYWPTLNTASTISQANQLSLSKGLLFES